jgi:hypothetical protein
MNIVLGNFENLETKNKDYNLYILKVIIIQIIHLCFKIITIQIIISCISLNISILNLLIGIKITLFA